jgi:BirA family biotin operon repressor/biotin-[acetyl-CoA-carboxylase] ligase
MFDALQLAEALAPRPVRYFPSLASTMQAAADWLAENPPEGALVIADEQTQGRGRLHHTWQTPRAAALALTWIGRNSPPPALATLWGGLALAETVEAVLGGVAPVEIKWFNDVLVAGRKVGGVLAEAHDVFYLLGLGLNVSVDFTGSDLEGHAASLHEFLPAAPARLGLLKLLVGRLEAWRAIYATHAASDYGGLPSPLFYAWERRLGTLGRQVQLETLQGVLRGRAEAVDVDGALWLRTETGERLRVVAGNLGYSVV